MGVGAEPQKLSFLVQHHPIFGNRSFEAVAMCLFIRPGMKILIPMFFFCLGVTPPTRSLRWLYDSHLAKVVEGWPGEKRLSIICSWEVLRLLLGSVHLACFRRVRRIKHEPAWNCQRVRTQIVDSTFWKLLYFEWSPPWHLSICYWQIFWHSIWHIFWHSIRHSIWHIFWHIFWYIFWHSIWHIFWHSIWYIFWHSIWHSIWHIFWHSICPLRSSSAHWAGEVPGWGPAVHTALGKSQVEVQRCTLGWAGPRLRSSGAHWAETVPGWGPAVHTELEVQRCTLSWAGPRLRSQCTLNREVGKELGEESWQRAWRRVGKAEVEVEVDADMVEEKLEGEEEEDEEEEEEDS